MKNLAKNFLFILLIFLLISLLFSWLYQPEKIEQIPLSQLAQEINQEKVKKIIVEGSEISIFYHGDEETMTKSRKEELTDLSQSLPNLGVKSEQLAKVNIEIKEMCGPG
jgi:ATP-dependent Zn protease